MVLWMLTWPLQQGSLPTGERGGGRCGPGFGGGVGHILVVMTVVCA
jgi:hypothetical protein